MTQSGLARIHELTKVDALIAPDPEYLTGAANLRFPTGGCPNGIPRYSETSEYADAACPVTEPLVVSTVCPTVKLDVCLRCRFGCGEAHTAGMESAVRSVRSCMLKDWAVANDWNDKKECDLIIKGKEYEGPPRTSYTLPTFPLSLPSHLRQHACLFV
jgi:hypothetical protein